MVVTIAMAIMFLAIIKLTVMSTTMMLTTTTKPIELARE